MKITKRSMFTGELHTLELDVTADQIAAWESGVLIQHAMPNLTPDEREFLMTGVTKEEWDAAFGGSDDEE